MKVTAALLALCALCGANLADASRPVTIDRYRGEVLSDNDSTVKFEVRREGGRPKSGEFVARNFGIFCDDELKIVRRFEMSVRFHGRRFFEADSWEITHAGGTKFHEVEGRLRSRGHNAEGTILIITQSAVPDVPSCNSDNARARWKARRV